MKTEDELRTMRESMVANQIEARGITDARLLNAMKRVPRHRFVPPEVRDEAYNDGPLPIGENQTISQPYIVALMTQLLELEGTENVLEVGTGCGYQTALLCELAHYVYSLERYPLLADKAGQVLTELGYDNVDIHIGDGSQGLADMGPFNAIIVTAAAPSIPGPLASQLSREDGRMVVPVGDSQGQSLYVVRRHNDRHSIKKATSVRFVPLVGRFGFQEKEDDDGASQEKDSRSRRQSRRSSRRRHRGKQSREDDQDDSSASV